MYLSSVSSRLLLHDKNNWDLKITNASQKGIMRDIAWSDDSKYMLQVNSAGLVEILCPVNCDIRSLQHISLKDTWSASFHRDGHRNIAIGTKSGSVNIWDTISKSITKTFPTPSHPSCVQILSYNTTNTHLAATMTNGDTVIYRLSSNIPSLTFKLNCSEQINAMKFHHESSTLLGLATDEGHVVLRDIIKDTDKAFFKDSHAAPVSDFSFSLINYDVLLSSGYDKILQVYDMRIQSTVYKVRTSYVLTSLALNEDNHVALGTMTGDIPIYDLRNFNGSVKILKGHDRHVSKVAFQPARRNTLFADVSLEEEVGINAVNKGQSPKPGPSADRFSLNNIPPNNHNNSSINNQADMSSFLLSLGLDESVDFGNDIDMSKDFDTDKNMSKISTPRNSQFDDENLNFPSPLFIPNNAKDDNDLNANLSNIRPPTCYVQTANTDNVNTKVLDELSNLISLKISDIADDNRHHYLQVMMALTKQKLYLEKQFRVLNQQLDNFMQTEKDLVEANKMLVFQIEQFLNMQQNNN